MRTVYRIVGADGAPVYQGDRAHALAKLGRRDLRDRLEELRILMGRYNPASEAEPSAWTDMGRATEWVIGK